LKSPPLHPSWQSFPQTDIALDHPELGSRNNIIHITVRKLKESQTSRKTRTRKGERK